MKAYQIGPEFGREHLKSIERAVPEPGPGEVLIQMRAVSLNSRDLGVINGFYFPSLTEPLIPVSDGVGEVIRIGKGVTRFQEGERVSAIFTQSWLSGEATRANWRSTLGGPLDGLLSEYVVLPEEGLVRVPEHLTNAEAATLPCAAVTAWHAIVEEGEVKAGDTVVLQGTGGVSIFALQFAKLLGASVIVTSSQEEKGARALSLGADHFLNYKTRRDWEQGVLDITEGRGADHIVDLGGADTLNRSIRALRVGGRISLVGLLSGPSVEGFEIVPAIQRRARLQAVNVGSRSMFETMNRAIALHGLRPVVDRIFPFAEAVEAFRYMERESYFGKLVIEF
ncbi:NAD(P)-dependent alcohol dehydrogenase [Paenibacillus aurantius]|uniref:NAD(P)-dependent alcohol dehydrogenase n=1 Tax=Paenibacillus aurantius TaxID=2918900 RepID=A0AA96RES8_9BACL|nr:NAD(P)-dependent alcohol dehydrogenase [Paenibacillus aurantius]WNQ10513.1 NAD(P)-dependent alcohol dehydrogenase [Paenibacillus aurantius]